MRKRLPHTAITGGLIFLFLVLEIIHGAAAAPAPATQRQFNGFYELGARDTSELFEKSDLDYFYRKIYLRFDDKISPQISWALAYQTVNKDYDKSISDDNYYHRYQTFWEFLKKYPGAYFKIDLDAEFKEQIFDEGSNDNQRTKIELGLAYHKEEDYFGRWKIGLAKNKYPENPDKSEFSTRQKIEAGKYFFEGKLRLEAAYRKEDIDRNAGTDRSQSEKKFGLIYRAKTDWLDTFRLTHSQGQRNTREDEDDDFAIDYNFADWGISSKHKIQPRITVTFKYENVFRDYLIETGYNNYGYATGANFKYEPIFQKLYYNLDFGYRARNYPSDLTRTNTKNSVVLKMVYSFPPGWRVAVEAGADFYRYRENGSADRNVWSIKPSIEKEISAGLKITLDYKFRFKDYLAGNDALQNTVRAELDWGF